MAVSLPLSGRVGVHHAGRVHPGANSQRLLLHAGRGPAGQVVLDPEHLRGPDGPTAAAAAVRPGEQYNTRKKLQETGKSSRKKSSSTGRPKSRCSAPTSKRLEVRKQPGELEIRRGRRKEARRRRRRSVQEEVTRSFIQLQNFWSVF